MSHRSASCSLNNMLCRCWIGWLALVGTVQAADSLVLLQYHHISGRTPASTSVTPERFEQHLRLIEELGIHVLPLDWALDQIRNNRSLPQPAVALTFDDGYRSVLTEVQPRLKARDWPYTLFVAPAELAAGSAMKLSRDELKQLHADGVLIANHSLSHEHLIRKRAEESNSAWKLRVQQNLQQAQQQLERLLGAVPRWLAYPYGEYNAELQQLLESQGWIGFGQHSGPVSRYSDWQALSRFPVSGRYSGLAALRHKLLSLPMPVIPARTDPQANGRAVWQVELIERPFQPESLSCFLPDGQQQRPEWLGSKRFQVEAEIPPGRSRFNCTAPAAGQDRFYWLSQPWVAPEIGGERW